MTEQLRRQLRQVAAPTAVGATDESATKDIVSQGLVGEITVADSIAQVPLALGAPYSPAEEALADDVRAVVRDAGLEPELTVEIDDRTPAGAGAETPVIIAVSSGKGGVGKSTVAVNLAAGIADRGARVGLFDADVFGPNLPRMLGVQSEMIQPGPNETLLPVERFGIKLMSVGFMVDEHKPVVWRGAIVDKMLTQFWHDVHWGDLEYLIIDLPPGTGDAQLTMLQQMPVLGSVVVTTPQDVALDNARKGVELFADHPADVFGIVENMSAFVCPTCGDSHDIFAAGGGQRLAEEYDLPLLARIPLDPSIRDAGEVGEPIVYSEDEAAERFRALAADVMDHVGRVRRESHTASLP